MTATRAWTSAAALPFAAIYNRALCAARSCCWSCLSVDHVLGWPGPCRRSGTRTKRFYAEAGREMVERRRLADAALQLRIPLPKPILFYWLVAGSFARLGVGEAQARLWCGAGRHRPGARRHSRSGVGIARRIHGPARRAPSSPPPSGISRSDASSLPDLPARLLHHGGDPRGAGGAAWTRMSTRARWLLLAGVAAGCAFLTKGPVGVVVAGAGRWSRSGRSSAGGSG